MFIFARNVFTFGDSTVCKVLKAGVRYKINDVFTGLQHFSCEILWNKYGCFCDPEHYIAGSAVFGLDRVTTPLLLLQGDNDHNVPYMDSVMMYNGLAHLGKVVEFVTYKGDDHGLFGAGHHDDFRARTLDWFSHYLKGTPLACTNDVNRCMSLPSNMSH